MSTSISQHGASSIRVAAGAPLARDESGDGFFQTIDITVLDADGRPLLEIICFTVDDLRTNIELDVPGLRLPSVYIVPAANPERANSKHAASCATEIDHSLRCSCGLIDYDEEEVCAS